MVKKKRKRAAEMAELSRKLEKKKAEQNEEEVEEAKQEVAASQEEVVNLHNMLEQKPGQWIEQWKHNV